jgi:hypothetical protein
MNKVNLPIVFIHKGNSSYLFYSIYKAKISNSDSEIFLIGTSETKHYGKLVHYLPIEDFLSKATELEKVFTNYSTNSAAFELFCLQRWFILDEFMKKEGIKRCVYIDSDILVYSNLSKAGQAFQNFDMTFLGYSPHTNFINNRLILEDFCNFIFNTYSKPEAAMFLEKKYNNFLKQYDAGGISDMTFFHDYNKLHPGRLGNISVILENSTFDITLDTEFGYEMEENIKKIKWINQIPHCKNLANKQWILFHTLHFQGALKKLMWSFWKKKTTRFYFYFAFFQTVFLFRKFFMKLFKWTGIIKLH